MCLWSGVGSTNFKYLFSSPQTQLDMSRLPVKNICILSPNTAENHCEVSSKKSSGVLQMLKCSPEMRSLPESGGNVEM